MDGAGRDDEEDCDGGSAACDAHVEVTRGKSINCLLMMMLDMVQYMKKRSMSYY